MKCPKCKKPVSKTAKKCKHCGAKFVRKSDKMARQMTISGKFAMACGGLMVILAIVLFIYGGDFFWMGVLGVLGALLVLVGKKVD